MTDKELVILAKKPSDIDNKYKLFHKYEKLGFKHLHIMERQLNNAIDTSVKEDFISDTYLVFLKALKAVDISKVKNDKWLFLGYYGFYLKNLRIKYINDILHRRNNETGLFKTSGDGQEYLLTDVAGIYSPDLYEAIEDRIVFDEIYKQFSSRQKIIADMKKLNYKNVEIAKALKISNTMVTFEIRDMKTLIKSNIE